MLGEANPELVVDETGTIVKLVNVVVTDELGTVYGLGSTIPTGRQIWVGDLRNDRAGIVRFRANDLADAPDEPDLGQRRALRLPGDLGLRPDHQRVEPDPRHPPHRRGQRHADADHHDQRRARPGPGGQPGQQRLRSTSPTRRARRSSSTSRTASRRRAIEIRNTQTGATANSDIVLAGQLSGDGERRHDQQPDRHDDHRQPARQRHGRRRSFLLLRTNVLDAQRRRRLDRHAHAQHGRRHHRTRADPASS